MNTALTETVYTVLTLWIQTWSRIDWQYKPSTGPAYSVWTEAAASVAVVVVAAAAAVAVVSAAAAVAVAVAAVAVAAVAVAAVALSALFADSLVQGQLSEELNLEPLVD